MKLILQKNHIYLPMSNNVVIKDASFEVLIKDNIDPNDYIMTAVVNGKQKVFTNYFTVNISELASSYLDIKIILTSRVSGNTIEYVSDKYPITRAVVLGLPSNEWYPDNIRSMQDRLAELEKTSKNNFDLVFEAIRELKNRGEVL